MSTKDKDKHGKLLLGIVAILFAGVVVAKFATDGPARGPDNCIGEPSESVVILLDQSEGVSAQTRDEIVSRAMKYVEDSTSANSLVSVFTISALTKQRLEPVFSRCRPKNTGNRVHENVRSIARRFSEGFEKPLRDSLGIPDTGSAQSPIAQALSDLSRTRYLRGTRNTVLVFSDMLENTESFSLYHCADASGVISQFRESRRGAVERPTFRNTRVVLNVIPRMGLSRETLKCRDTLWVWFFGDDVGPYAGVSIDYLPGGETGLHAGRSSDEGLLLSHSRSVRRGCVAVPSAGRYERGHHTSLGLDDRRNSAACVLPHEYLRRIPPAEIDPAAVDSVYYFGFLLTVASLALTAIIISTNGGQEDTLNVVLKNFGVGLIATGYAVFARLHLLSRIELITEASAEGVLTSSLQRSQALIDSVELAIQRVNEFAQTVVRESQEVHISSKRSIDEALTASARAFDNELKLTFTAARESVVELRALVAETAFAAERAELGKLVSETVAATRQLSRAMSTFSSRFTTGAEVVLQLNDAATSLGNSLSAVGSITDGLAAPDGSLQRAAADFALLLTHRLRQ